MLKLFRTILLPPFRAGGFGVFSTSVSANLITAQLRFRCQEVSTGGTDKVFLFQSYLVFSLDSR